LNELINSLRNKDFGVTRKWVTANSDQDSSVLFRKIYDGLYDKLQPNSVPQLVLILAKYQYQNAFVADSEINVTACLVEIMIDCSFR
jgi:hypothetical protein